MIGTHHLNELRNTSATKEELRVTPLGNELSASLKCLRGSLELTELVIAATFTLAKNGVSEWTLDSIFGHPLE
jgi:hypothetical protein